MLTKKMVALVFFLGLVLMVTPAMADPVITINDSTDTITFSDSGGFDFWGSTAHANLVSAESPTSVGFVNWDFYYVAAYPPTQSYTFHYNIYEPSPSTVLSDTLEIIIIPAAAVGPNINAYGEVHFRSDSIGGGLLTAYSGGTTLHESGGQDTVWIGGITVNFTSDVEAAVPEPATMLLLGSGLLGLAGYGRKKFFKK